MLRELPDLTEPYAVSEEKLEEYRDKGHVLLRQVATQEEIASWGPYVRHVALEHADDTQPVPSGDGSLRKAVLQLQNLWCVDEDMRRFCFAPRFARIAADLLGVDAVRMYHDQAVFKEPGASSTPMHQDHYYFPLDGDDVITMWMPLVPVSAEMGSMSFATGSHKLGYVGAFEASDASERELRTLIEERNIPLETHGAMAPGDATFHTSWTLHGAPPNPTGDMRAVMTIIWFADGLTGIEPQHDWHRTDYEKWMPDVKPGEPAAGRLNPLVWRRS